MSIISHCSTWFEITPLSAPAVDHQVQNVVLYSILLSFNGKVSDSAWCLYEMTGLRGRAH